MLMPIRARFFKPRLGSVGISSILSVSSSSTSFIDRHIDSFLCDRSSIATTTLEFLIKHHALIVTNGNSDNIFIASKLISSYASLGKPHVSFRVFDSVSRRDGFLWNSIIKAYFSNGDYSRAVGLFFSMRLSRESPDHFTVPMVVSSCAELLWEDIGNYVHGLVLKCGIFEGNTAIGSSFVHFYAKCGRLEAASLMFDEMPERDVVAWTAIISGHVQNDESEKGLEYLCEMHRNCTDAEKPNSRTLERGFQACANLGALTEGRCLHSLVAKNGLSSSQMVQSSFFSLYAKCGSPVEAYLSFHELGDRDMFSWTSVISSLARSGNMKGSFDLFWEMQTNGIQPDEIVISCLINELGNKMLVSQGKAFHGLIIRHCYPLDATVSNAFLSAYCKFELLSMAEKLFRGIPEGNKDAWNLMVKGYGKMKCDVKCVELFRQMQNLGIEADYTSLASVISSCSRIGAEHVGKSLHCYVVKSHLDRNISVVNSLIDLYGKTGDLTVAWRMFRETEKNIITWNTMIASYVHCDQSDKAIALFDRMISENLKPTSATLVTVLTACANLGSLETGQRIHMYITEGGYEVNLSLATALVGMYAKCGQLEKSRELFDSVRDKDAVCWNVMISGYGLHGHVESAIELFHRMEESKVEPNGLTYLALLSACKHSGFAEEGKYLFQKMHHHNLKPSLKHYACMVDLLARSGDFHDAEAMVMSMSISPDHVIWGNLLSICLTHNEFEMGIRMAQHAIESDPHNDGYHITLANMYSAAGNWELAERARKVMKELGVEKRAGHSSVSGAFPSSFSVSDSSG
ncbi:PREDICTED: pentatricopeptide repeat-containing protein At4g39952, mitochondrial [Tarenaya hassleriana]|uniref:pentatricopeptide repeat-containing protein At4g39952, mitochondrial n=1 Tax=Tarenaya hassleriana TaxID=28532 RepID=UPI00053C249D|nr:PREDICTED: pentatricopeptide repeat-containing protein At4g39952, mitochondrial [Tarenaya hassleriana]